MNNDLATALRRALQKTCASDPSAATAIIQAALSGQQPPERADSAKCAPCEALAGEKRGIRNKCADYASRFGWSGLSGLSGNLIDHARIGRHGATRTRRPAPVRVPAWQPVRPSGSRSAG